MKLSVKDAPASETRPQEPVEGHAPRPEVATTERPRLAWIDWLKAIGITIVVCGHARLPAVITPWLHSFLIPLFFVVSGYLISPGSFGERFDVFWQRRLARLVKAYFFFGTLGALQVIIMSQTGAERSPLVETILTRIGAVLYGTASLPDVHPYCLQPVALWFFPAFVTGVLLAFAVMQLPRRVAGWTFGLIAALAFVGEDLALPWEFEAGFAAAPLLALGYWLRQDGRFLTRALATPVQWSIVLLAVGWVVASANPAPMDFRMSRFGVLPLFVLAGGLSLTGVLALVGRWPANRFVARLSAASIFIFPTHQLVFWVIDTLARDALGVPNSVLAGYPFMLGKAVATLGLLAALYPAAHRRVPWL